MALLDTIKENTPEEESDTDNVVIDPEEERLNSLGPRQPYQEPETDEDNYQDQEEINNNPSAKDVADAGVGAIIAKNAPRGSWLRSVQSRIRLARSKAFGARDRALQGQDPFNAKQFSEEEQFSKAKNDYKRYQNFDKSKALDKHQQDSYDRLAKRLGDYEQKYGGNWWEKATPGEAAAKGAGKLGAQTAGRAAVSGAEKTLLAGGETASLAGGEAAVAATGGAVVAGEAAAVGGATAVGAEVGSAGGPVGIAIGAAVGVLAGLVKALAPKAKQFTKQYWPLMIIVVCLPILAFLLVLGLTTFKMNGLPLLPTTEAARNQATTLTAIGGDLVSQKTVTQTAITATRDRFKRIKEQANADTSVGASYDAKFANVQSLIDQIEKAKNANNMAQVKKLQTQVATAEKEAERGLPWGKWIAADALKHVGNSNATFTKVTGAPSNLACASFVSSVLNEVGVPQNPVGSTGNLWSLSPGLYSKVIGANIVASNSQVQGYIGQLQPGDIVFWADSSHGIGSVVPSYDHVGIYIGDSDHNSVDTSTASIVKERPVDKNGSLMLSGAIRYAP